MAAAASLGSPASTYTLSPSPRPHSARAKAFQEGTFSGLKRQDSLGRWDEDTERFIRQEHQPGWGAARAVTTKEAAGAGGGGGEVTTSKTKSSPKTKKSSPKTKTKTKKTDGGGRRTRRRRRKKRHRRRQVKHTQRGGSIQNTQCGSACPYSSRTTQFGGKKKNKKTTGDATRKNLQEQKYKTEFIAKKYTKKDILEDSIRILFYQ